jgi:hypothetical protein
MRAPPRKTALCVVQLTDHRLTGRCADSWQVAAERVRRCHPYGVTATARSARGLDLTPRCEGLSRNPRWTEQPSGTHKSRDRVRQGPGCAGKRPVTRPGTHPTELYATTPRRIASIARRAFFATVLSDEAGAAAI